MIELCGLQISNTLDTVQPLKKELVGIWLRPPPHNAAIWSLYAAPLPRGVVRGCSATLFETTTLFGPVDWSTPT